MLEDTININNLCWNPAVLKKAGKTSEKLFLDPICIEKGSLWTTPKMKKKFFLVEIAKADHQLSESFYFIKISYILTELWIFFLSSVMFSVKKVSFPASIATDLSQYFRIYLMVSAIKYFIHGLSKRWCKVICVVKLSQNHNPNSEIFQI